MSITCYISERYKNISYKLINIIPNYSIVGLLLRHDDFKIVKSSEYKRNYFSRKKYITHKMKTKILSHPQKRSTIHLTISFHLYLSFFQSHFEIIKNTLERAIVFLKKSQCQLKSVFRFCLFCGPNNCFLIDCHNISLPYYISQSRFIYFIKLYSQI